VQVTPEVAMAVSSGHELSLFTAFLVREDAFLIFGFRTLEELQTFDLLRSVTGVGPKSALSIIHQLGVEALSDAVSSENEAAFKSVSGIGPKTAKLLIVTLAGKLVGSNKTKTFNQDSDITSALVGLGYQLKIAEEAVRIARKADLSASNEQVLRTALQNLAR
jgi:Holliday junction DNA helicase RuvA